MEALYTALWEFPNVDPRAPCVTEEKDSQQNSGDISASDSFRGRTCISPGRMIDVCSCLLRKGHGWIAVHFWGVRGPVSCHSFGSSTDEWRQWSKWIVNLESMSYHGKEIVCWRTPQDFSFCERMNEKVLRRVYGGHILCRISCVHVCMHGQTGIQN